MLSDEIKCSFLDEQIIGNCGSCFLRKICEGIDMVGEELKERTTMVKKKGYYI